VWRETGTATRGWGRAAQGRGGVIRGGNFSAAARAGLGVTAVVLLVAAGTGPPASAASAGGAGHQCGCALRTAYVVSLAASTVTPVSTRTNKAGPPIPVTGSPWAIAITP
jgi:hypothetical protein